MKIWSRHSPLSEKQRKALDTQDKKKIAVNDISFTANSREVFGLLGSNGAGKTTTMRMLATLIKPDSGDALHNNVSIVKSPEDFKPSIGQTVLSDVEIYYNSENTKSLSKYHDDHYESYYSIRLFLYEYPDFLRYEYYFRRTDHFPCRQAF